MPTPLGGAPPNPLMIEVQEHLPELGPLMCSWNSAYLTVGGLRDTTLSMPCRPTALDITSITLRIDQTFVLEADGRIGRPPVEPWRIFDSAALLPPIGCRTTPPAPLRPSA